MRRSRLHSFLILSGVNLVLLALLVVAIELAFGQWFADYYPPYGAIFDRQFTYRQNLYEPHGLVTYVRDKYGLRSVHGPIGDIKLVTVGGSTTDQRFITEGKTWQDVIHELTGISIANAGVDGLSSSGHVVAVEDWLHRIPKLHPRYYLHYLAVNDALYVHEAALNDPSHRATLLALLERQIEPHTLSRTLRARSIIVRDYLRLTAWLAVPASSVCPKCAPNPARREVKAEADRGVIQDFIDRIYKPNLRRLIALHQGNGEGVILVSQPAHPQMVRRAGDDVFVRIGQMDDWAIALAMLNDTTQAVCREQPDACTFIDLARRLQFEPEDFYDFVHATPAGARRIGAFLANELRRLQIDE